MSARGDEVRARALALDDLIHLRCSVEDAVSRLRGFDWDAAPDLATLTPAAAVDVLNRYVSGEVTAEEVGKWANAIEGRDDIAYPPPFEPVLNALIFELANPEISRPLTAESALDWTGRLHEHRE